MQDDYLCADILVDVLKKRKEELGLTNVVIAERSGVPESTVAKVFNGSNRSPSYDTIAPIARILGVSLDVGSAVGSARDYRADKTLGLYVSLLCCAYEEQLRKKDKWIIFLVVLLVIVVGVIIGFTVYDYTHPDVGWVRYTTVVEGWS